MNLQELRQHCAALYDQQLAIANKAVEDGRGITAEEQTTLNDLQAQIDETEGKILALETQAGIAAKVKSLDEPAGQVFRPAQDWTSQNNRKLDDGGFRNVAEFVHDLRFGDMKGRIKELPVGQGEGGGVKMPDAFAAQIMPWRFRNEWSMGVGEEGGFAIPAQQWTGDILMIKSEPPIVRPRAAVIPPGEPPDGSIPIPAFAQGSQGVFGGVTVTHIGEGDAKPETDGKLREVVLTPQEVAATTVASDKFLRNWQAAYAFIGMLLRGATTAAEDMDFLRGNGVAKPVGASFSPGAMVVNRAVAGQISYPDTVNMFAKLLPESVGRAVWIASQGTLPQIATLQDNAGKYIFIQGDATKGIPATLSGIPIKFTGKMPGLGNKGDLMLADFTYYLIKDGSGPFVAASEHVLFRSNKTIVKIFWNYDGKSWVDAPLTLENGTDQASPFVVLDVPAV